MAGNTVNFPSQIQAGAPGAAMLGSNTRVRGQSGFLGTQLDQLTFTNGAVGNWLVANQRVRVNGVFAVSATAQGIAQPPGPTSPVPVTVVTGDPRIRSL